MFRKTIVMTLLLFLSISISAPSFAGTVDLKHDNTFLTTIVRYYDSWDECNEVGECKAVGESLVENNNTYYLAKAERVTGTEKFIATYLMH